MPTNDLVENLRCPDCRGRVSLTREDRIICSQCGRTFCVRKGVINMLPTSLQRNIEDAAWKILPYEGANKPAWMALIHKKDRVLDFYERILPFHCFTGRVLEVGAGTSWASALIKKEFSQSLVVAADISPFALEKGVDVAELLDSTVDCRVACDAECLPFADEYFDVVLSNATIHHFHNPLQGIREIWRVLRFGAKVCALGEIAAGTLFTRILTSRMGPSGKRAGSLGVEEKVYKLKTWIEFYRKSGFTDIAVHLDKGWEHKLYDWFPALYYRVVSTFPDTLLGNFLPCNVDIYAVKSRGRGHTATKFGQ